MGDAQKRADFAASISRMSAYFEGDGFQEADVTELETRLERLSDLFKKFDKEHSEIVSQTLAADETAVGLNRTVMAAIEDLYLMMKAKLVRKIKSLTNPPPPATTPTPPVSPNANRRESRNDNENVSNVNNAAQSDISAAASAAVTDQSGLGAASLTAQQHAGVQQAFPFIGPLTGLEFASQTIPQFGGDTNEWLTFRDSFKQLVHTNDRFYPLAKFNALANHLYGDAAKLLDGLPRTDEYYQIAWEIVLKEYDDPQKITDQLLDTLAKLKSIPAENNLPSLRYVLDL